MPINESHPIMNTPQNDYKIWRYMDIPSFTSLLLENALTFIRAELMEDKFEGTLPKISNFVIDQQVENMIKKGTLRPEYRGLSQWIFKNKFNIYLNCWIKEQTEMVHMWKIYSKEKGIAIETTYNNLKNAIVDEEVVYPTNISYVDFNKDYVDLGANMLKPYTIKRIEYKSENEFRLIVAFPRQIENQVTQYNSDEIIKTKKRYEIYSSIPALKIKVDISKLIETVHISPYAPKWYNELIRKLLDKFELNTIQVVQSEL